MPRSDGVPVEDQATAGRETFQSSMLAQLQKDRKWPSYATFMMKQVNVTHGENVRLYIEVQTFNDEHVLDNMKISNQLTN